MQGRGLIVFIKNPIEGKVKTRIAEDAGNVMALNIYQALLHHTNNISSKVNADRYLYYSDYIDHNDEWPNNVYTKTLQHGDDLGSKMQNAFINVLSTNNKVIIIGSDCIQLSEEIIEDAYIRLDNHDVVIGPTYDGGYYLLGLKNNLPSLFQNMHWSTDTVYDETVRRAIANGLSVFSCEVLSDIDHLADWERYGHTLR